MNLKDLIFSNIYKTSSAFGLDISDSSLKIAQLKKRRKFFELRSYNRVSLPEGLIEEGVIKNKDKLIETIEKLISNIKGESLKTPYVVCSLPEQHGFIKVIRLPLMNLDEVHQAIKWEAEANIPFSLDEVYLSWQVIPSEKKIDHLNVLISAAPKNLVDKYLEALRGAGLEPVVFEIESVATVRSLIKDEFASKPVLIIDLGFNRTSFIIFSGRSIQFTNSISTVSTREMLEAISRKLKY